MSIPVPHATVLTVSRDEIVLYSRNEILRQAGYKVLSTLDETEAVVIAHNEPIDAVVLGDSIPCEDRNALVRAIRAVNRSAAILVLCLGCDPVPPEADGSMDSLDGAKRLLDLLGQMLNRDMRQSA